MTVTTLKIATRRRLAALALVFSLAVGASIVATPVSPALAGNGASQLCVPRLGAQSLNKPVIIQTVSGAYTYVYSGQCYTGVYAVYSEAPSPGAKCYNSANPSDVHYWGANQWVVLWDNAAYFCTYSYA